MLWYIGLLKHPFYGIERLFVVLYAEYDGQTDNAINRSAGCRVNLEIGIILQNRKTQVRSNLLHFLPTWYTIETFVKQTWASGVNVLFGDALESLG